MIKRIIFDIDMTLLDTQKDCLNAYQEYFNDLDKAKKLYDVLEQYDLQNRNYEKDDILLFINDNLNINLSINDLNNIFNIYQKHGTLIDNNIPSYLE